MGWISLHSRQRKLLNILKSEQRIITSFELARKIEVSDRTVRDDILQLNKVLAGYGVSIVSVRGKGYILHTVHDNSLHDLIYASDALQTKEDRVRYLTMDLIYSDKPRKLADLEDEMFISRTTLENDIRLMKLQYSDKRPFLQFLRQKNGIRAENDERKKRLVLSKLFIENWDYNSKEGMYFQDSIFNPDDIHTIMDCVKVTLKKYSILLDDYEMLNIVFIIAIANLRIVAGHELQESVSAYSDEGVKCAVDELLDELELKIKTKFSGTERDNIGFALFQRRTFDKQQLSKANLKDFVDSQYIGVVEAFLNDIKNQLTLDFTQDERLFMDLVIHVKILVVRLKYAYERKSPVLEMVKKKYPYFLEMSIFFRQKLLETFQLDIDEHELSYIAVYLILSMERFEHSLYANGIPVAFVSHLNFSSNSLMMMELKSALGSSIDFKGPFSIYEKEKIVNSNASLLITTVQMNMIRKLDTPVVIISPQLREIDIFEVNKQLSIIKNNNIYPALPVKISQFFQKELYFRDLKTTTKEEIIMFMADELQKKAYVGNGYSEHVLVRESIASTAFDSGIAIPHTITGCCNRTVISVATLDKPVTWDAQKVSCVFLIAVREQDRKYMWKFLNLFADTPNNKNKVKRILNCGSYEELVNTVDM